LIKYLGSKRRLVPLLVDVVRALAPEGGTVLDLFSGTSRVGHALKRGGWRVLANDELAYAATLARCYVEADAEDVLDEARRWVAELDRLPGRAGYVTETFCVRSRYFRPENGARIDAIREAIADARLAPELEAVLLTSLLEAADRVDSTVGVQMAWLKDWAPRAFRPLALRVPDVLPRAASGKGAAWQLDAADAAGRADVDVAYLDPPYNQHRYVGNYHVWETIVRDDRPEVYGVACKRIDARGRKSPFNGKRTIEPALHEVLGRLRARAIVVSYNDEGHLPPDRLEALLAEHGHVAVLKRAQPRYVGARIGIHDPRGRKVGTIGRLSNHEHVYVVTRAPLPPGVLPEAVG
jgi:adenine-specific DNA-methyltransferase